MQEDDNYQVKKFHSSRDDEVKLRWS